MQSDLNAIVPTLLQPNPARSLISLDLTLAMVPQSVSHLGLNYH